MRLTFFVCLLATPVAALEDDVVSPDISSFQAGIICAIDPVELREAPNTVSGTINIVDEPPPFVSNGRYVPAVIGVGFGMEATIPGGLSPVLMRVTHPPFDGTGATEQSYYSRIGSADDASKTFYQFDFPYELAIGTWTFEASFDGYVLYTAQFEVVAPASVPELAEVCNSVDLLS